MRNSRVRGPFVALLLLFAAVPPAAAAPVFLRKDNPTGLPDLTQGSRGICAAASIGNMVWEWSEHPPFNRAGRRLVTHPDNVDPAQQGWPGTFGNWAADGNRLVLELALFIYGLEAFSPALGKLSDGYGPTGGLTRYLGVHRHLFHPNRNPEGLRPQSFIRRKATYARVYNTLLDAQNAPLPALVATAWEWFNANGTLFKNANGEVPRHSLIVAGLDPNDQEIYLTNGWDHRQAGRKTAYDVGKPAKDFFGFLIGAAQPASNHPVETDFYDRYTGIVPAGPRLRFRIPASANNNYLVRNTPARNNVAYVEMYQYTVLKQRGSPTVDLRVEHPTSATNRFVFAVANPEPDPDAEDEPDAEPQEHFFVELSPAALARLAPGGQVVSVAVEKPLGWEVEVWDPSGAIANPGEDPLHGDEVFAPPSNAKDSHEVIPWRPAWRGLHWFWTGLDGEPVLDEPVEFAFLLDATVPYSEAPINLTVVGEHGNEAHYYDLIGGPFSCVFTADDGTRLVLEDRDDDGFCEFPEAKTVFRGTFHVDKTRALEFTGKTLLEADRIVVDADGRIKGSPETLRALSLVALKDGVSLRGEIDVDTSDDLTLQARVGDVEIIGPTALRAADRLLVEARNGGVVVAPFGGLEDSTFTALAGNRIDINARSADGDVQIAGARIGSRRVTITTRANLSVIGDKVLAITDGSELTTDLAATGLPPGSVSDVKLDATGRVTIARETVIDSGRNVAVQTSRAGDALCLSDDSTLEARNAAGVNTSIDLRSVRGGSFDDGTTTFVGTLRGTVTSGPCP